jgi:hypothetical protein
MVAAGAVGCRGVRRITGRKERLTAKGDPWLDTVTRFGRTTPSAGRISGLGDAMGGSAKAGAASISSKAKGAKPKGRMLLFRRKIVVNLETI